MNHPRSGFAFVNSSLSYLNAEYNHEGGLCTFAADGTKNPCPEAFGALLGTGSVVGLIAILFAFTPPRILRRVSSRFHLATMYIRAAYACQLAVEC